MPGTIKNNISLIHILQVVVILAIPLFPCFSELGKLPIRIWDEGRQAHNAFEMFQSRNYWVPTFDGIPDTFGTKPAVLIWMQVWSMMLFGVNEFAIRFPSAVCTSLLSIGMMLFAWKYFKSYWIAILCGILLLTSEALIRTHVARTGDYDAPLACFTGLGALTYFIFLDNQKRAFLYSTFLFFALAVLMKGTAGLLFLPSLFIYTLTQKKLLPLLKEKHTYLGILLFLILVAGYYIIRNEAQPGYWDLVVKSEWKSMYLKPAQGHDADFWFYIINGVNQWFRYYWYFVVAGLISYFLIEDIKVKKIILFSFIILFGFLLIISLSATKLFWYDAPVYIFVVLICAGFFYYLNQLWEKRQKSSVMKSAMLLLTVLGFGIFGGIRLIPRVYHSDEEYQEKYFYTMATYLQNANKEQLNLSGFHFLTGGAYAPHHSFYLKQMQSRGQQVGTITYDELEVSDSVILFESNMQELMLNKFHATLLRHENDIFAYQLDSLKAHDTEK